jgi:hypothetical protein
MVVAVARDWEPPTLKLYQIKLGFGNVVTELSGSVSEYVIYLGI